MDFTREPIIETVITARDGHRIVVRNSKNAGQEEFFVDALEVVSFHNACFYRCLERPKAFIVPVSDYEVLEIRESRISLKSPSFEGLVKASPNTQRIDMGQQPLSKNSSMLKHNEKEATETRKEAFSSTKEIALEKKELYKAPLHELEGKKEDNIGGLNGIERRGIASNSSSPLSTSMGADETISGESPQQTEIPRLSAAGIDRRKEKKKSIKRRRGALRAEFLSERDEAGENEVSLQPTDPLFSDEAHRESDLHPPFEKSFKSEQIKSQGSGEEKSMQAPVPSLLPPPTTLIRDELARMRNNELYKGVFYTKEEVKQEAKQDETQDGVVEAKSENIGQDVAQNGSQNQVKIEAGTASQEHQELFFPQLDSSSITAIPPEKKEPSIKSDLQKEVEQKQPVEKKIIASSLFELEDEDDSIQSNAYTARPSIRKKSEPIQEGGQEPPLG